MNNPLDYVGRGWEIFPCHSVKDGKCTCGKGSHKEAGKHPRTMNGVKDATRDPRIVAQWVEMYGADNINWALACGAQSGVLAIDLDPRHNGDESLAAWELANGKLPDTLTNLTGGGGLHLLFKYPHDGADLGNKVDVLPGVDVRSNGGYIMLPSSMHISGRAYTWREDRALLAAPPQQLLDLIRTAKKDGPRPQPRATTRMTEGNRNDALFRKACSARRALHDDALGVEAVVRAYNAFMCEPPLDSEEVDKILGSAWKQDHAEFEMPDGDEARHRTDDGNAYRLVDKSGDDLRYVPSWGWMRWSGKTWVIDTESTEVLERARQIHQHIRNEADGMEDPTLMLRWATQTESAGRIKAMIELAKSDTRISRAHNAFDADPYMFSCGNGVLDLRTGLLRPHSQDDLITKATTVEYDPNAVLEAWDRFILQACDGDPELVSYVQRAVGYSMTGSVKEEAMFLITGPAASGKSTFISAVMHALGGYSCTFMSDTILMRGQQARRDNELAFAAGLRMAAVVEMPEGERLDEAIVKQMTGGDAITARFLYKNPFTYHPQFKLWIATNHEPRINDQAIWRRIKKVPFPRAVAYQDRDPHLKELVTNTEAGSRAVLAWAVKGCAEWSRIGLAQPERVTQEVAEYYQEQDRLADFITDTIDFVPDARTEATALYVRYVGWCSTVGERAITGHIFQQRMRERAGITRLEEGGKRYLVGIALKEVGSWGI